MAGSSDRTSVFVVEALESKRRVVQLADSADCIKIYRWHGRGVGFEWAMETSKQFEVVPSALGSAWRQKSRAAHTNDPFKQRRRSVEFGWSTFPGGS
eukprot:3849798-Pleurochrysis_carterae.AAC.1